MTSKFATCMMDRSWGSQRCKPRHSEDAHALSDFDQGSHSTLLATTLVTRSRAIMGGKQWPRQNAKKQFNIFWRQIKHIRNKRSEWSKQKRSIRSSETSTDRTHEGSRWLQVWFPDSIGFGQVQGPMLQRVGEVKASLTQCESEFFVIFSAGRHGFGFLQQNPFFFQKVDWFHVFKAERPYLLLFRFALPKHAGAALCFFVLSMSTGAVTASVTDQGSSGTSQPCYLFWEVWETEHILLLCHQKAFVGSDDCSACRLMHPRFLNMTREYLTATFAVDRFRVDSDLYNHMGA